MAECCKKEEEEIQEKAKESWYNLYGVEMDFLFATMKELQDMARDEYFFFTRIWHPIRHEMIYGFQRHDGVTIGMWISYGVLQGVEWQMLIPTRVLLGQDSDVWAVQWHWDDLFKGDEVALNPAEVARTMKVMLDEYLPVLKPVVKRLRELALKELEKERRAYYHG